MANKPNQIIFMKSRKGHNFYTKAKCFNPYNKYFINKIKIKIHRLLIIIR